MRKAWGTIAGLLILSGILGITPARAITFTQIENSRAIDERGLDMSFCGSTARLQLADGSPIRARLALSYADRKQGLSGLRTTEFAKDEALLMLSIDNNLRSVNMGDMHFSIDVFFLDADLKVVGLHRDLKAHPGKAQPPMIENSPWVYARHIMEMRADSPYAARIQPGSVLRWRSKPGEKEIERCMADVWKQQNATGPDAGSR